MPLHRQQIQLDRQHAMPLARQLYMQLYRQIMHGQLGFNERLPASRELAKLLGVARGVIIECYDMLKMDGLVAGFGKAGTRVVYRSMQQILPNGLSGSDPVMPLSIRGEEIANARHYETVPVLPLMPGVPDYDRFPFRQWQRAGREVLQTVDVWYQRDGGVTLLKQKLSLFLRQYRGIEIRNPAQLLVTQSTQASLSFLTRMLADRGDYVLLEEPGWAGTRAAARQAGLRLMASAMDGEGAVVPEPASGQIPRLAILTPSSQYPTGQPMSLARRKAFFEFSQKQRCWLVEDDFAAEFSYAQHPLPSMLSHSNILCSTVEP